MGTAKHYPVDEWAHQIYEKNQTVRQVARRNGVSSAVVRERLYRAGHQDLRGYRHIFGPASHSLNEEQVVETLRLRRAGMSWRKLGQEFGMSANRIRGIMRYQCLRRDWEWPIRNPS